ncbi:hypothetical protein [Mycolicibacterium obuense]|uniref:hypothetical protein n=1 Tax=Mycolicibacterium obuense TaxID=1807 RepID=UPI0023F7F784|nr:hypothetical protein [Mycolicibacterium obuense]
MKYAPEDVRIDVANAQHAVVHALENLRIAVEETSRIPDVEDYAVEGDTEIAAWLYTVERIRAHVNALAWVFSGVEQIDPRAGRDDFGPLDQPSHARDVLTARNARKGSAMQADPFAPTPVDAGVAAFGVSRPLNPDNPFADVFAPRGTFGHVAQ